MLRRLTGNHQTTVDAQTRDYCRGSISRTSRAAESPIDQSSCPLQPFGIACPPPRITFGRYK